MSRQHPCTCDFCPGLSGRISWIRCAARLVAEETRPPRFGDPFMARSAVHGRHFCHRSLRGRSPTGGFPAPSPASTRTVPRTRRAEVVRSDGPGPAGPPRWWRRAGDRRCRDRCRRRGRRHLANQDQQIAPPLMAVCREGRDKQEVVSRAPCRASRSTLRPWCRHGWPTSLVCRTCRPTRPTTTLGISGDKRHPIAWASVLSEIVARQSRW